MQESRKQQRRKTFLGAQINLVPQNESIECLVRNFSDAGAKLMLAGKRDLPEEFALAIPCKGVSYDAHVKWRHQNAVGVALRSNLLRRVVSLEEERRNRARLAE